MLTAYKDIKVGDTAVTYDSRTGQVSIGGNILDGHLLLELASRVKKARIREGREKRPAAHGSWVASHMTEEQILAHDLNGKWESLLMFYRDKYGEDSNQYARARAELEALRLSL
jgi:hypothetical protein